MSRLLFKISFLFLAFSISFTSFSFEDYTKTADKENPSDNYTGKRKRNSASPASKRALSRQPKHAQHSIKKNEKRNRKNLKQRSKKQKRQHRYSKVKTFR